MLNIIAEALLLATRIGQSPTENRAHPRRTTLHEFHDEEGLRIGTHLRNPGR